MQRKCWELWFCEYRALRFLPTLRMFDWVKAQHLKHWDFAQGTPRSTRQNPAWTELNKAERRAEKKNLVTLNHLTLSPILLDVCQMISVSYLLKGKLVRKLNAVECIRRWRCLAVLTMRAACSAFLAAFFSDSEEGVRGKTRLTCGGETDSDSNLKNL